MKEPSSEPRTKKHSQGTRLFSSRLLWFVLALLALTVIVGEGLHFVDKQISKPVRTPKSPYAFDVTLRVGNINGVPIAVPANYLFFPVEYVGESIWAPRKGKERSVRTVDSPVQAFSIYAQWPDLKPRSAQNDDSYAKSVRTLGAHEWVMVGVTALNLEAPLMRVPQPDNYLGRRLKARHKMTEPGQHYVSRGVTAYALHTETPEGQGVEKSTLKNKLIYWDGESEDHVRTLIECTNGLREPIHTCRHSFELTELKADVAVTYTINWLPQWKEIEQSVRKILLGFRLPANDQLKN